MTTNAIEKHLPDVGEAALVMAVGIVVERIARLSEDDRRDLYELVKELPSARSAEDLEAVRTAMVEILDQEPVKSQRLEMAEEERPPRLQRWVDYISARIRELRIAAGLTQTQLAERSGLPQSHISRLEAAQHSPSHATLQKLAAALNIHVNELDPSAEAGA
jgi:ribosome-binding protein aMBF1 (putative translation factor)